jgi:hypothetical protein
MQLHKNDKKKENEEIVKMKKGRKMPKLQCMQRDMEESKIVFCLYQFAFVLG